LGHQAGVCLPLVPQLDDRWVDNGLLLRADSDETVRGDEGLKLEDGIQGRARDLKDLDPRWFC
jgi:hypothetical protein